MAAHASGGAGRNPARVPYSRKEVAGGGGGGGVAGGGRFIGTVGYDGTLFAGWQTQRHGNTVQDALEQRLTRLLGAPVAVAGSGRTDAGVHARRQCCHFDLPPPLPGSGGARRTLGLHAGHSPAEAAAALARALVNLPENSGLMPGLQVLSVMNPNAPLRYRNPIETHAATPSSNPRARALAFRLLRCVWPRRDSTHARAASASVTSTPSGLRSPLSPTPGLCFFVFGGFGKT
jgi:hypothetical protein